MGVVKTNKVLMHNKLYSSFDTRLKSFEKCKKSLNQDVGTLCAAGFYYTGKFVKMLIIFNDQMSYFSFFTH